MTPSGVASKGEDNLNIVKAWELLRLNPLPKTLKKPDPVGGLVCDKLVLLGKDFSLTIIYGAFVDDRIGELIWFFVAKNTKELNALSLTKFGDCAAWATEHLKLAWLWKEDKVRAGAMLEDTKFNCLAGGSMDANGLKFSSCANAFAIDGGMTDKRLTIQQIGQIEEWLVDYYPEIITLGKGPSEGQLIELLDKSMECIDIDQLRLAIQKAKGKVSAEKLAAAERSYEEKLSAVTALDDAMKGMDIEVLRLTIENVRREVPTDAAEQALQSLMGCFETDTVATFDQRRHADNLSLLEARFLEAKKEATFKELNYESTIADMAAQIAELEAAVVKLTLKNMQSAEHVGRDQDMAEEIAERLSQRLRDAEKTHQLQIQELEHANMKLQASRMSPGPCRAPAMYSAPLYARQLSSSSSGSLGVKKAYESCKHPGVHHHICTVAGSPGVKIEH